MLPKSSNFRRQNTASWESCERCRPKFRYRSPPHFVEVFKTFYGPVLKAFAALDTVHQTRLEKDIYDLIARMNKAEDGTMVVPSEYLEVVMMKR
jgi:hypothetical protein